MSLYDGCRNCGHGMMDHPIGGGRCAAGVYPCHCSDYLPPVHRKKPRHPKLRAGKEKRVLKMIVKKPMMVQSILTELYLSKYDIPILGMHEGCTWPMFDTRWIYQLLNRHIDKGEVMRIKRPHKPFQYQRA